MKATILSNPTGLWDNQHFITLTDGWNTQYNFLLPWKLYNELNENIAPYVQYLTEKAYCAVCCDWKEGHALSSNTGNCVLMFF